MNAMMTTKPADSRTGPAPDRKSFLVPKLGAIVLILGMTGCAHHYRAHLEMQGCVIDSAISWTCPWEIRQ